ncbi:MAG: hypothetical protein C5B46_06065 [Proteobacteria bacterium]|nr:MAG: hypothetical protein C5B46_06065 [Pseudomonadota bacterium]
MVALGVVAAGGVCLLVAEEGDGVGLEAVALGVVAGGGVCAFVVEEGGGAAEDPAVDVVEDPEGPACAMFVGAAVGFVDEGCDELLCVGDGCGALDGVATGELPEVVAGLCAPEVEALAAAVC